MKFSTRNSLLFSTFAALFLPHVSPLKPPSLSRLINEALAASAKSPS